MSYDPYLNMLTIDERIAMATSLLAWFDKAIDDETGEVQLHFVEPRSIGVAGNATIEMLRDAIADVCETLKTMKGQ